MTDDDPKPKRPATWLAVLLNLILPPVGYAYIGALRWAVVFVIAIVALGAGMVAYSVLNPPGFMLLDNFGPLQIVGLALNIAVAIHVGLLNRQVRSRRNLAVSIILGLGLWLIPMSLSAAGRYLAPIATYQTASSSMEPTLIEGDVLLSNGARAFCGRSVVKAGDVIFSRRDGVTYSHRAVAGPGETVEVKAGRLIINGESIRVESLGSRPTDYGEAEIIRETLSNGVSYLTADMGEGDLDNTAPIKVPEGHWFTLGDNRDNSIDSRVWGPVPHSAVCGVAVRILSSSNPDSVGARP